MEQLTIDFTVRAPKFVVSSIKYSTRPGLPLLVEGKTLNGESFAYLLPAVDNDLEKDFDITLARIEPVIHRVLFPEGGRDERVFDADDALPEWQDPRHSMDLIRLNRKSETSGNRTPGGLGTNEHQEPAKTFATDH